MRQRHLSVATDGNIHFVTTVTRIRGHWFRDDAICRALLESLEFHRAKHAVDCLGYVLMPDHVHILMQQKGDGPIIPRVMEGFKKWTSHTVHPPLYPPGRLWHERYDDVAIPNHAAVVARLVYMHNNPCRRNLAEAPEDYPWSSCRDLWGLERGIVTLVR